MTQEALWVALPMPAFLVDCLDNITAANPAAETFLALSAKALVGVPIMRSLAMEAPLEDALSRVRSTQTTLFINDVAVGGGGCPPRPCDIRMVPYMEGGGQKNGHRNRHAGQVLLLILSREMAGHISGRRAFKRAAKSAIGMSEMLAHEIKNPLAGIIGAAQLLAMSLPREDQEMTDLIVSESRRIVTLLEQVDQFGNLSVPARRPVNLHDALERARKSAEVGFAANMRFSEDYDPSLPLTFADGDQLMQVFLNIMRNAAQAAGPAGGMIRLHSYYEHSLRLRRKNGQGSALPLRVEIIDDGPGLPADISDEIFEPFVSGRVNGTGLGLALVSKIILDHEGWITVTSRPGRTVFRILLPLAPPLAPPRDQSGDQSGETKSETKSGAGALPAAETGD